MSELLLHHYWPSPFAHKVRIALRMIGASWTSVEIPRVPPKPLLVPMTAGYRRTPVMQVGADIYCDTQNIARALAEAGYEEALFPNGQRGLVMALSGWIDQSLVELAIRTVITNAIGNAPADFIKDRGDLYFEPGWSEESLKAGLPAVLLQLGAQAEHAEKALERTGYIAGDRPSWADAGLAFCAWFLRGRWAGGADFLSRYPAIERLETKLAANAESHEQTMSGEQALAVALAASPSSPTGVQNPACDLSVGQQVLIRPRTQSSDPDIVGRLRYLDMTRISIDHESPETGPVAVHLPLAGYRVSAA